MFSRYGALRLVSVEQGYDPRDFSLVAFGGAGPLHANALGKLLRAFPVIIPPSPGVLCAFGDATTLLRHEVGRTFIRVLLETDKSEISDAYEGLLHQVEKIMCEEQGVPESKQVRLLIFYSCPMCTMTYAVASLLVCAILIHNRTTSTKPIFDIAGKLSTSP